VENVEFEARIAVILSLLRTSQEKFERSRNTEIQFFAGLLESRC